MDAAISHPLALSFKRHFRASNRSERTVHGYLDSISQVESFLARRGRTLVDADRANLEASFVDLPTRQSAPTAWTRHKHLRVLYRWLEEEEEIDRAPMAPRPARPTRRRSRSTAWSCWRWWGCLSEK
jgi:site-specific recombinase XerD